MDKKLFLNNVYGFIRLISLYLHKEKSDIEIDDKTLSFYIRLAKAHSLRALLYKSITDTGVRVNKDLLKELEEAYLYNLRKTVMFEKEREDLYKYLNDNQIDYLPLKGLVIRNYYPDIYEREYSDYDILFDEKKDKLVKDFFRSHGFTVKKYASGNHDVYTKKPFYNFELHRALFSKSNKVFRDYFINYLFDSPIKEKSEHHLEDEQQYIYFTAHSFKHFRNAGCGLRTIVDYYLYLEKTKLDFEYINKELEKIEALEFSNNIRPIVRKLFNDEHLDEKEEELLLHIASSGTFGTTKSGVEKGVKKKGKFRYLLSRIFPPMAAYPAWATRTILLIPIAWFLRLVKNTKKAKTELKAMKDIKNEND